jgi:chorismate dehydratase
MIRISAVSYTNTLPFIYGLNHHPIKDEIELSLDVPAICAQKLINNQVDIGLVPVAALLDMPEYHIISDYCIGANGAVNSVFIFSNCPINQVKFLQLDPQSKTSNNLALVLLKNYWKVEPNLIDNAENYGKITDVNTAFVQIGDRTFGQAEKYLFAYDLALEWKNFTGLEFVFAAWVSNKILDNSFIQKFNNALKLGLANKNKILEETDTNNFDLEDYLNHKIDYELTENKRKALKMFHHFIETINHQISI